MRMFSSLSVTALLLCLLAASPAAAYLPDSGLTQCFDNAGLLDPCPSSGAPFYGQDANYAYNPPSYTNNGDGTVTDARTGLVWERDTASQTYAWGDAETYCSDLDLGGAQDWRLPKQWELETLVIYDGSSPAIAPVFTNARTLPYWTNQEELANPGQGAWVLWDGLTSFFDKTSEQYVRCVRTESMSHGEFTDNGDGTVTDRGSGLVWQQQTSDTEVDWEDALAYCQDLSLAGKSDWRLPSQRELNTTLDLSATDPGTGAYSFQPLQTVADLYWSSTTKVFQATGGSAFAILFDTGETGLADKASVLAFARCVRVLPQQGRGGGPATLLLLDQQGQ